MRDPRIDPKAGDVLIGSKSVRMVGRIYDDGSIGFTYWRRWGGVKGNGNECVTSLASWRKWGAAAEVENA